MTKFHLGSLPKEEIRRGWVRLHENYRNGIKAGTLIKIGYKNETVIRVILGNDKSDNRLRMDEPTRERLGLENKDINGEFEFNLSQTWPWDQLIFYWSHPDFSTRFASKLSIFAFGLSVIQIISSFFHLLDFVRPLLVNICRLL